MSQHAQNEATKTRTSQNTDGITTKLHDYCVVLFTNNNNEEREYAAVPTTWLSSDEKYCFWPENSKNIRKLIKNRSQPNESYQKYNANVLQKYDTYERALLKERRLMCTSSQTDDDIDLGRGLRKRKSTKIESDSDDTDTAPYNIEDDLCIGNKITKLLHCNKQCKIKKSINEKKKRKLAYKNLDECDPSNTSDSDSADITPPPSLLLNLDTNEHINSTPSTSKSCRKEFSPVNLHLESLQSNTEHYNNQQTTEVGHNNNSTLSSSQSIDNTPEINSSLNDRNNNILRLLLENIIKVKNAVTRIEQKLSKGISENTLPNTVNTVNFEQIKSLPLNSLHDLEALEGLIKENSDAHIQLVFILHHIGGNNIKESIQKCLKKLFTNECAMKCSLTGAKKNYPLRDLKLLATIKESVIKLFPAMTDTQFEEHIKAWFRHASQRHARDRINK